MFVYIGYSHDWPGVVAPSSNGGKSCCFGRETHCSMEIPDGLFDAWAFIDIDAGMVFLYHRCLEVVADGFCGMPNVFCVVQFCTTRQVKNEYVLIVIAVDGT